ncbi:hypothetical protein NEOKW01_1493 [Nematocida sp. AWRm80]|nr:hypothetical protein NEOKW01_1493 [Nematocida sp. AWRm80]
MKETLRIVNSVLGILVTMYANLDIGKPLRLRSVGLVGFVKRFYHLTHIGLLLSTITFMMAVVVRKIEKSPVKGRNSILMISIYNHLLALVITAECFIPVLFWILWHIDESTVVRKQDYVGEDTISLFFNLCMHGIPSVFLLVEFMLFDFKTSRKHYLSLAVFFLVYLGIMGLFYYETGGWPYNIINTFGVPVKIAFFAGCFMILCVIYEILAYIHIKTHGTPSQSSMKVQEKKPRGKGRGKRSK